MPYSSNSPIHGTGTATAASVDAWFSRRGPEYKSYAPDGKYRPAPPVGASVITHSTAWGINSDLVAALMLLESAAWQSRISREKNNPSGYGAINSSPYESATTFPSPDAGIRATVAHLASYINGHGDWDEFDPRQASIIAEGWLGVVRTLADLNGRWAFPGTTYGAGIAALANDLVAFVKQTGGAMAGDDSRFDWTPDTKEFGYPQGTHGRNGQSVDLLILHITAGTDSQEWLLAGHGSSTHYLTKQDGSPRAQHVAEADAAWTPGSRDYALRSINVEVEMLHVTDWTDAIMREVAATIAPMMQRHNIPAVYLGRDAGAGKRGMIGHRDVPDPDKPGQWGGSSNHDDPGQNFRWDLFVPMVAAALAGGVVIPPDVLTIPNNPHGDVAVVRGFKGYVETLARARYPQDMTASILSIFGYPEMPEYLGADGNVYQMFERQLLQWSPVNAPPFDVVMLRREDEPPEAAA